MAGLGQIPVCVVAWSLAAQSPPGTAVLVPAPRRLSPAELTQARHALAADPDRSNAIASEHSFEVAADTWVLPYLARKGPHTAQDEVGIFVVRGGVAQHPPAVRGSKVERLTGIKAISFFDANQDGNDDIVVLYLSAYGSSESTPDVVFWVSDGRGSYSWNGDLRHAVLSVRDAITSIADVKKALAEARVKQAERAAWLAQPPTHSVKGSACSSKVAMNLVHEDDGTPCLQWTTPKPKCRKGDNDEEWFFADYLDSSICLRKGEWTYEAEPPGQDGDCSVDPLGRKPLPSAKTDPSQAAFEVNCEWVSGGLPRIRGANTYRFSPLPRTKAKLPKRPPEK